MTTRRQRLDAIEDLRRTTRKPTEDILAAVGESWGLSRFERAELAHELQTRAAQTAKLDEATAAAKALKLVATEQATEQARRDAYALSAFRRYEAEGGARIVVARHYGYDVIERGRQLATALGPDPDDNGGPAAA